MERVVGRTLKAVMDDDSTTVAELESIKSQLLQIIAAFSRAGFAHNDMLQGNVMIGGTGGRATRVVIIDFGSAAPLDISRFNFSDKVRWRPELRTFDEIDEIDKLVAEKERQEGPQGKAAPRASGSESGRASKRQRTGSVRS